MRITCPILTLVTVLAPLAAVASPPTLKAFPGMISLSLEGQTLEGRPIAWTGGEVHLLGRDGRLWEFAPNKARNWREAGTRFQPYSISQLRAELLRELGRGFSVSGTGHYVVAHPVGERNRWPQRFEDLYRSFVHYFSVRGFKLKEPDVPLIGVVCGDRRQFARYTSAPPGVLGFYSLRTNRITLYDISRAEGFADWHKTDKTILHEATHQAAFNTGIHSRYVAPPTWVAEGLATLFEAPGVYDSRHYPNREDRINQSRLDDFRRLVLPQHSPELIQTLVADDRLFRSAPGPAYAESWALTFYLVETQSRKYADYVARTAARPPFTEYTAQQRLADFTAVFGDNWPMLEARLLRFIDTLP